MQFTRKRLRALGCPEHAVAHLRSRRRGTLSATGGFHYQRCFAVLRVLELAASRQDGTVFLDALCPVDDVVVESGGHHEHSQVKESAVETWGRNGGKLRREFLAQDRLMKQAAARSYCLQIVTPHGQRASHFRRLAPAALKGVLAVRRFPHPRAAANRPWIVPDVARALDGLLLVPFGGTSQREQLWVAVNHACRTPWRSVRVRTVVEDAGRFVPMLPLRDPMRRSAASKREVAAALDVLNAIPRLDARIVDGICLIECAGVGRRFVARVDDSGFARFIRRILLRRPVNYRAVRAELP